MLTSANKNQSVLNQCPNLRKEEKAEEQTFSISNEHTKEIITSFITYLHEHGYSIVDNNKNIIKHEKSNLENMPTNNTHNSNKKTSRKTFQENFNLDFINEQTEKEEPIQKKKGHGIKTKNAWLCPHLYKPNYARGKCQNCYLNHYHREKVLKKKNSELQSQEKSVKKGKANKSNNSQEADISQTILELIEQ
jgi:hypothetical protein